MENLNATGQATMDDFDFVDNENSKMFDTSDMHKI